MSKGYAIRVHNQDEADQAVKAFEDAGYKRNNSFNYILLPHDKYVIVSHCGHHIEFSLGSYAKSPACTILKSINDIPRLYKQTTLKVGDSVKVKDLSWAFCFRNGKGYSPRKEDLIGRKFIVMTIGQDWPISTVCVPIEPQYRKNDMVLVAADDNSFIIVTNSNFPEYNKRVIKVGEHEVKIEKGKNIKVGCTTIDKETVDAIIREWQT